MKTELEVSIGQVFRGSDFNLEKKGYLPGARALYSPSALSLYMVCTRCSLLHSAALSTADLSLRPLPESMSLSLNPCLLCSRRSLLCSRRSLLFSR